MGSRVLPSVTPRDGGLKQSGAVRPQGLGARFAIHDRKQLEIKLDYRVDPKLASESYSLEAWFFLPHSLGVCERTYALEDFYSDLQTYARYKTPEQSIPSLLDASVERSPLTRIAAVIPQLLRQPTKAALRTRLHRELRLFGCQLRGQIRDRARGLDARIEALAEHDHALALVDFKNALEAFLADCRAGLSRLHGLRRDIVRDGIPQRSQEDYLGVDEYVTFTFETFVAELLARLDASPRLRTLREPVVEALREAREHSVAAGYLAVRDDEDEGLLQHLGALKKRMTSVLFLEILRQRGGRRVKNLTAGIAAAIAMFVSTVSAFFWYDMYAVNSVPLVLALCLTYVFKDRVKDTLKHVLSNRASRWLWDYNVDIRDLDHGTNVGRGRETVSFLKPAQVPPEIVQLRRAAGPRGARENVLRYRRVIDFRGKRITHLQGRLHDINEILRFNISPFLQRMGDPVKTLPRYDPERDQTVPSRYRKTYHVSLVVALHGPKSPLPRYEHLRLVLDRKGFRRLEKV